MNLKKKILKAIIINLLFHLGITLITNERDILDI